MEYIGNNVLYKTFTASAAAPNSNHSVLSLTEHPTFCNCQSCRLIGDLGGNHFKFIRHYYLAAIQNAILPAGSQLLWVDSRWLNENKICRDGKLT